MSIEEFTDPILFYRAVREIGYSDASAEAYTSIRPGKSGKPLPFERSARNLLRAVRASERDKPESNPQYQEFFNQAIRVGLTPREARDYALKKLGINKRNYTHKGPSAGKISYNPVRMGRPRKSLG